MICSLYYPVKSIVYNSSLINKSNEKIHRCSKTEMIVPIVCYIIFSGALIRCGQILSFVIKEKFHLV